MLTKPTSNVSCPGGSAHRARFDSSRSPRPARRGKSTPRLISAHRCADMAPQRETGTPLTHQTRALRLTMRANGRSPWRTRRSNGRQLPHPSPRQLPHNAHSGRPPARGCVGGLVLLAHGLLDLSGGGEDEAVDDAEEREGAADDGAQRDEQVGPRLVLLLDVRLDRRHVV